MMTNRTAIGPDGCELSLIHENISFGDAGTIYSDLIEASLREGTFL